MKWFHHECSAKYDPKLHLLGEAFGAEGVGVYWGLLEEIGYHSDTFHVRVAGVSAHSDEAYLEALLHGEGPMDPVHVLAGENVPIIHLGILARLLFTTEERLLGIIEKSVALGLFDPSKWRTYGLLHSPAFEQRADNYTRRRRRRAEGGRENSERPPNDAPARFAAPRNDPRVHSAASPNDAGARSCALPNDARALPDHRPGIHPADGGICSDNVRILAGHRPAIDPADAGLCPDNVRTFAGHRPDIDPADAGLCSDNVRTLAGHRPDIDPADAGLCSDNVRTLAGHRPDIDPADAGLCSDNVRTLAGHSPASVSTSPNNVLPEQTTEQKQKEKEIQKQRKNEIEKETKKKILFCSVPNSFNLSTVYPHPRVRKPRDDVVLVPSADCYTGLCTEFRELLGDWNQYERTPVDWIPIADELKKLSYGGDTVRKLWFPRRSEDFLDGSVEFQQLVIRALRLMLEATGKQRIQNSFGWVWSCPHGPPEGMAPWVHVPTALMENHAGGEDIGAPVQVLAVRLLGRGVRRGAERAPFPGQHRLSGRCCDVEVENLCLTPGGEHDIRGFDVPVHHPGFMGGLRPPGSPAAQCRSPHGGGGVSGRFSSPAFRPRRRPWR